MRTLVWLVIAVLSAVNVFTIRSVWGQLPLTIEEQRRRSFDQTPNQTKDVQQEESKYFSCRDGPQTLRAIDDLGREGKNANMQWLGRLRTPEDLAEALITDCSNKIASLSLVVGLLKDQPWMEGIVKFQQAGLDFMKWWLLNRRQKLLKK